MSLLTEAANRPMTSNDTNEEIGRLWYSIKWNQNT
jgi:hypothetical protein